MMTSHIRAVHDPRTERRQHVWSARCGGAAASVQRLTLTLAGITADDYLSWVRDPEPLALGRDLRRVTARAEALGDRIELELIWDREPPAPRPAAVAAGFPLVPEVVELATGQSRAGTDIRSRPDR